MGNATATAKGPDSRPFSPDFGPGSYSPRDLTASPIQEDGLLLPKNKLLLSQHSTEDRDNYDDRAVDDDGQVSDFAVIAAYAHSYRRVVFERQQS